MKRLLALALTVLMLLSAIPVAGAASFKDSADITVTNVEAVDIMSDLKVFSGFPEGDFQPKELLTRAQAAKILCCLALGNTAADALPAGGSTFSDVPASHWANKYVEYCASKGIVSGVGSGKFDPNGKLTGYAFGKMLLVALGEDASQFSGAEWGQNVQAKLYEKRLALGVTVDDKGISRQDACHLALNALFSGEKDAKENTLAYKAFGVTRATSGAGAYGRPALKYTSAEDSAYWTGTVKKVTASPAFYKQSGAVKGGDLVKALNSGDVDVDHQICYRNGAKGSKLKESRMTAGTTKNITFTGEGVRFEAYYSADTDKYTLVSLWYGVEKLLDVVPAVIGEDGQVETPGSVMFESGKSVESNEFTKDDVGSYVLVYGTGKSRTKITSPREVFRGKIVSGKLTKFNAKKGLSIDGAAYKYPYQLNDVTGMKKFTENGGAVGDEVKALITPDNLVVALWK